MRPPRQPWTRDDWLVLAALAVLLVIFVLLVRDQPPTSWLERDFR
ncbi:hypothetical protein [Jiangella rhizosphaerae]|nr:hypothetical protein [Jiangella rhizosphaerae]